MPIIALNGKMIPYCLTRSFKAKRLRLEYRLVEIKIVAPYRLSNYHILQFLFQQKSWIVKQLMKSQALIRPPLPLLLPALEPQQVAQFRIDVYNSIEKYSQLLGRRPTAVVLKTQRRRWGSCGIHDQIYINWILMMAPLAVLEYVVLHECCHLFHRNHGRHFWNLVQKHMPDYKVQEKWLRQHTEIISYYQNQQGFMSSQLVLAN